MNTRTLYHKLILLMLINIFLTACSVEKKTIVKPEQEPIIIPDQSEVMIENPDDIVLPPATPIEAPATRPVIAKPPLTKAELFSGALDAHNKIRSKHRLKPLKWSNKLAAYSQQWADHLGSGPSCRMRHRGGTPPYGENLYRSSATIWSDGQRETNRVTIRDVVKVWTDEERWYDYNRNRCQPGQRCGHYTQIVWRDTTEVGCAVKICGDKSQTWVCSYNPPGNFTGVRPY